jgi:hypothetical protein
MVKSSPNFIITLTREIKVYSDGSGDLDGLTVDELKEIVIALKRKELNNYIAKNKADVFVQNLYEDIDDLPFKDNRDMVMLDKVGKYFKL